ncbi:hypothetical protein Atai01_75280 [Amycolatopsis taiwanensis]|uniref:Uncharacterized protein n=1 Tax=Amycolatopsis taiwanensis TaxID=342230 RepID=A0A9W6R7P9_9PSEU|nr:hypothetical protein Atai01_75280 [Amycolatopsis taiwanensis]
MVVTGGGTLDKDGAVSGPDRCEQAAAARVVARVKVPRTSTTRRIGHSEPRLERLLTPSRQSGVRPSSPNRRGRAAGGTFLRIGSNTVSCTVNVNELMGVCRMWLISRTD